MTTDTTTIKERVYKIVIDKLGVNTAQIAMESNFINDLGADSLGTMELIMEFEDEFKIDIPDEEAEEIRTVGEAVRYIEKHLS